MNFFPSRTLTFYMTRMFLIRVASVAGLLFLVLLSLDLLGQSGKILAQPGNGNSELWTYVTYRAPQIISFVLPFSVLLGTLITLATLNQNSEVIAMKSGGLSAHQILAPLFIASFGVAALLFAFNESVVAPATAKLSAWERVDFGKVPMTRNIRSNIWVRDGDNLVRALTVAGRGEAIRLSGVTVFSRTRGGLRSMVQGDAARLENGRWRLSGATRFDVATGEEVAVPNATLPETLTPDQFTLSDVDADALSFAELRGAIAELDAAGRPTRTLEASLWHKISGPLSSVLMPLLGAVAAFGLARSGQLFVRAVIGMALGFAYFVADNFSLAMGNIGAYPPLLAAWAPFVLFFLIGETVLVRTEE